MELDVDREPAVLQALDEIRLPQRAVPVEQCAVQPRRQLQEIPHPTRTRQGRVAHVVVHVHFVVERPGQVADAAEDGGWMLAERRLEVGAFDHRLVEVADEVGTGVAGRLEQL